MSCELYDINVSVNLYSVYKDKCFEGQLQWLQTNLEDCFFPSDWESHT